MGKKTENISIIDSGLILDGTIKCRGQLIIKGTVRGVLGGETVIIAEEGRLYAESKVVGMTIGGYFEGEVTASEELVILSTGSCNGNVLCKNLTVEAGGILNAHVRCTLGQKADGPQEKKEKGLPQAAKTS